jgi:hypothetical protein
MHLQLYHRQGVLQTEGQVLNRQDVQQTGGQVNLQLYAIGGCPADRVAFYQFWKPYVMWRTFPLM